MSIFAESKGNSAKVCHQINFNIVHTTYCRNVSGKKVQAFVSMDIYTHGQSGFQDQSQTNSAYCSAF